MAQIPILNLPQIGSVSEIAAVNSRSNLSSIQGRGLQQDQEQKRQQFQNSQTLNALKQQGLTDPKARAIAIQLDPNYGKQLQDYQAAQQEFEAQKSVYWGGQAGAVADSPLGSRGRGYKNIYDNAARAGIDVSSYPSPSKDLSLRITDAQQSALEQIRMSGVEPAKQLEMAQKRKLAEQKISRGEDLPSDVRSYKYYQGLDPNQQQDFLNVKRDVYKTGLTTDEQGNVIAMPGITGAKTDIKAAESEGTALGKIRGTAEGEAIRDLPLIEENSNYAIKLIDDIIEHPGLKSVVGAKNILSGAAPMLLGRDPVAGSDAADFKARLDQIKGKQFLEAFQSLKGGGHITEIEGEKATQAISRMKTSQSEKEFIAAAREFKGIVQQGMNRARNKAKRPANKQGETDLQGLSNDDLMRQLGL